MSSRYSHHIKHIHFFVDFFLLNISSILAYNLTYDKVVSLFGPPYIYFVLYYNIIWFLIVLVFNPYKISRISSLTKILNGHLSIIILHLLFQSLFFVIFKAYFFSREYVLMTYLLFCSFIFVWKSGFIVLIRNYRSRGFNNRNVIIFGYGKITEEIINFFNRHPELGYQLKGLFDNKETKKNITGKFPDIVSFSQENKIDEIYCCLPYVKYSQVGKLIEFGEKNSIKIKLIADFRGFSTRGLELERYDYIPVLNVNPKPIENPKIRITKRTFDILFSAGILITAFPIFFLLSLITWVTSRGPIFYNQERIGQGGKPFKIYKFRSMYSNSEECGPCLSSKADMRITPWGKFMRKTRLDELPQFYNVLIGEMSIVGPRPERKYYIDQIMEKAPHYRKLHLMKPGITSLGQVKFGYAENVEEMVKRLRYDVLYINNVSFSFDLKMILLTVLVMVQGKGK